MPFFYLSFEENLLAQMILNKTKIIFLIIAFAVLSTRSFAQDDRVNVIKINPLSLFLSNISTFYERGLTPRSSVQLGINYMNFGLIKVPISGYGITAEYRYHTKKKEVKTPKGFYVGPWARYQDYTLSGHIDIKDPAGHVQTITGSFSAAQYSFGGLIGYEIISKKGFTLDLFLGPYYNYISFSLSASYSIISIPLVSVPTSGIGLRSGLGIGYAF